MGLFKTLGKVVSPAVGFGLLSTGKSAAKRTERAANDYAAEAMKARKAVEDRTAKERRRASKLAIRGLRSKRSAGFFAQTEPTGSPTIG